MPEWLSKFFLDVIKLSPRFLVAFALASGFLLFADPSWVQQLGLSEVRQNYRTWIGATFLLSVCLISAHGSVWLGYWSITRWKSRQVRGQGLERLRTLTAEEKHLLSRYISGQTRTQQLDATSGTVVDLESLNIISLASNAGDSIDGWSYIIQPWAWKHLNAHPEWLILE